MRLGKAKCPYCGQPLSTAIKLYESHLKKCNKNPNNIDDEQSKQWVNLNNDD